MTTTPGTASYRAYAGEDVITGEGVAVELPVASVPHRMASGAIDLLVIIGILLLAAVTFGLLTSGASQAVAATFGVVAVVVATVVVPSVVETLTRGRSLGRLIMGLRIVRDDGGPVGARHALTRALIGFVEVVAFSGVPAVIAAMIHPRGKRLGDMAAGTYAVSQRAKLPHLIAPTMPWPLAGWAAAADISALPSGLAIAIRQFLTRAGSLGPQARETLGRQLLADALTHVAPPPPAGHHPETVLTAILSERRSRDAQRLVREESLRARLLR